MEWINLLNDFAARLETENWEPFLRINTDILISVCDALKETLESNRAEYLLHGGTLGGTRFAKEMEQYSQKESIVWQPFTNEAFMEFDKAFEGCDPSYFDRLGSEPMKYTGELLGVSLLFGAGTVVACGSAYALGKIAIKAWRDPSCCPQLKEKCQPISEFFSLCFSRSETEHEELEDPSADAARTGPRESCCSYFSTNETVAAEEPEEPSETPKPLPTLEKRPSEKSCAIGDGAVLHEEDDDRRRRLPTAAAPANAPLGLADPEAPLLFVFGTTVLLFTVFLFRRCFRRRKPEDSEADGNADYGYEGSAPETDNDNME